MQCYDIFASPKTLMRATKIMNRMSSRIRARYTMPKTNPTTPFCSNLPATRPLHPNTMAKMAVTGVKIVKQQRLAAKEAMPKIRAATLNLFLRSYWVDSSG